ncbi:MAG: hypothetical protein COY58_09625 [Gammaproteobacteria bacterium CG_4_10_14_0_8_um_filter_38_16]|nr:MAG: hypothetical protein COY58_09625 [Gammaproteobacteria bacterium CG_4_10_14_0_8_um_filter_38_16]PJA03056.1 MAG: hypothetical protein COX72_07040 [Gammaproteobacteria bacterium CG_4_10_14_0_2_um_filter_38_22]PJB10214.1 MAG: hypothetical protein CO120_05875 [Gammaproteobacteria bacterium CG_4_9_14_3_um_filter_38_9]
MSDNSQESPDFSTTPGRLLAAARHARPLSQDDIAKQMRLSVQAIQDIENDHYERFAASTFVRGHLRTYAKLVGISEAHVLSALDASELMPLASTLKPLIMDGAPIMNVTRQSSSSARHSRWMAVVIGMLIVIGLVMAWQGQKNDAKLAQHAQKKIASDVAQLNNSSQLVMLPEQTALPVVTTTASPATPVSAAPMASNAVQKKASDDKSTIAKAQQKTKTLWTKKKDIVISSSPLKPTYTLSAVKNT